jgi:peptidyl-tRNA hydrolase
VGIGPKKHPSQDLADHVLGRIPDAEQATLHQRIPDFIQNLQILFSQGLPAAQNLTNRKTPTP